MIQGGRMRAASAVALDVTAMAERETARAVKGFVLRVLSPRLWLSVWGGTFFAICSYLLGSGFHSAYAEGRGYGHVFDELAYDEWSHPTEHELHIASHFEGFWIFCLLGYAALALCFAWLFEPKVRAKLSIIFGIVAMACFLPGIIYVGLSYDKQRPAFLFVIMGAIFFLIFLSGVVHLREEKINELETRYY